MRTEIDIIFTLITVSFFRVLELFDYDPVLGEGCLMDPLMYLRAFVEAIYQCQSRLIASHPFPERLIEKELILPRLTCLPITPWSYYERIPTVHSLKRLISFRGTVVRTGGLKLQEYSKEWECSKCKTRQNTFVDDHQYGIIPKPSSCSGCINGTSCKNTKFQEVRDPDVPAAYYDYQEIKIQELTNVLSVGAVPRSILVILRHELVDQCRAGDDLIISGVYCSRFKPNPKPEHSRMIGEFFIQATSIQSATSTLDSNSPATDEEQMSKEYEKFWTEIDGDEITFKRSKIVNSFCPHIHGMFLVKLATLMTVIGGSDMRSTEERENEPFEDSTGVRQSRREGHLLLVGDPGKEYICTFISLIIVVFRNGKESVPCSGSQTDQSQCNDYGQWHHISRFNLHSSKRRRRLATGSGCARHG